MSDFYQKKTLSYEEAQKSLNNHLSGLEMTDVLHGSSDTRHLLIKIYSKKHDNDYYLSIGTDNWSWKDNEGEDISVISDEIIEGAYGLLETTDELKELIKNKLIIKKIELSKKKQLLKIYLENNSILEAQEDTESVNQSHYQLSMFGSKIYQNYDLLIVGNDCEEKITNGTEHGEYKVAMFDLDYFKEEHRSFTIHAIQQARERKSPVSFIQARVLYRTLTTSISNISNIVIFSPWGIRRSSNSRTRLDTIPAKELIAITRDECTKNNFTEEEATDILKSTIDSLKEWLKIEKEVETIARQEYGNEGIFRGLVEWYEETFA